MSTFNGCIALITGAGSGIGRATACNMARGGAHIAIVDRNRDGAEETAALISREGGTSKVWEGDVTDYAGMAKIVGLVESVFGKIDILVNNAGVASDRCPLEDVTPEMFERSMRVHVGGTIFTTQAVLPGRKNRASGAIVNLSSIQGQVGYPNGATYNAAKGGILALTTGRAKELAPWHIRGNAVAPGHCLTPMPLQFDSPEVIAAKEQTIPLKRYGQPEDMAHAIVYLASEEASFVTGQVISPNGGFQMT